MKIVLVLSALASLALAAPLLGDDTTNIDPNLEASFKTTDREKKSPHLKLIKKPIIIKKKLHLFRDDDAEEAGQERCAKIKLCDADKLQRATDMMKATTLEDMDVHFIGDDLEHSIKMAKAAVENLQKDLMKMESNPDVKADSSVSRSDIEFHEDIENTKQALDKVHKNFGNLEAMSLVADNADSKLITPEERLAQWQTAMETIQRNVDIAKNIEDSFKSPTNHQLDLIGKSSIENKDLKQKMDGDNTQISHLKTDEKQEIKMADEMATSATHPKESQIKLAENKNEGLALYQSNKAADSLEPKDVQNSSINHPIMDQTKWAETVTQSLKERAKSLNETIEAGNKTFNSGNTKETSKTTSESRNGGSSDQQKNIPLLVAEEQLLKLSNPIISENRDNSLTLLNKEKENRDAILHKSANKEDMNMASDQIKSKSALKLDVVDQTDKDHLQSSSSTAENQLKLTENKSKKTDKSTANLKTSTSETVKAANTLEEMDKDPLKHVEKGPKSKHTENINSHETEKSTMRAAAETMNPDNDHQQLTSSQESKKLSHVIKHSDNHHHHHHHVNHEESLQKSVDVPEFLNQPNMEMAQEHMRLGQPSQELSNNRFKSVGQKMPSHLDTLDTQRRNMEYYDMEHSMKAADSQIHNTFHGMNHKSNPMFLDQHQTMDSMDFDAMSQNNFHSPNRINMMPHRNNMHINMREPMSKHATDYMQWKHGARTSYGSPEPIGSSSGGAVGVFPNANVGNCAIPLLLSCNPSVVSGSLAKPHTGYSAPSYRDGEEFNYLRKRDVKLPHTDDVIPTTKTKRMSSKH